MMTFAVLSFVVAVVHGASSEAVMFAPTEDDAKINLAPKSRVPTPAASPHNSSVQRHVPDVYGTPDDIPLTKMTPRVRQDQQAMIASDEGIYLTATGEPKSGTTWLGRLVVGLYLHLCGSPENAWCAMSGTTAIYNSPAPWYIFKAVNVDTGNVFLRFNGRVKHEIFGLEATEGCARGGIEHPNDFGWQNPCPRLRHYTREGLVDCLPDSSPQCAPFLPPQDPARRRMAVVFRDPRYEIISEHRMRINVYHQHAGELEPFIRARFMTLNAWIHQRWVWHTTVLKTNSLVVLYEALEVDPLLLVDLAAFVGLNCTSIQANEVWRRQAYARLPDSYNSYGLSVEMLTWMNDTMSKLLPEEMLIQYDLPST